MRMTVSLLVGAFALLNLTPGVAQEKVADNEYIPQAAREAVGASQKPLYVLAVGVGSAFGTAFLVNSEGWAATAFHVIKVEQIAKHVEINFGEIPASVKCTYPHEDLAFLKLEKIPAGMRPVDFAPNQPALFSEVFTLFSGYGAIDQGAMFEFNSLPYKARIVNDLKLIISAPFGAVGISGKFSALDRGIKQGFSGSMMVDREGKVVGMANFTVMPGNYGIMANMGEIKKRLAECLDSQSKQEPKG